MCVHDLAKTQECIRSKSVSKVPNKSSLMSHKGMYKDICKGTSNQKILSWIMFHFLQGKLYKIAESQIIFDETLAQCENQKEFYTELIMKEQKDLEIDPASLKKR